MVYRNKANFVALAATLMAGTALVPSLAHAQDADTQAAAVPAAAAEADAGDIIVTANKRSQSINSVGLTISALGTDTLEKQGIKTLDDLAKSVPGLSFAATDFGAPVFTLRGVGYYDNSIGSYPTTSVYVDEVPLPFSVMSLHTNLDLERVEVLKGPQGTLFGQNSTGGAINFVAAKPTDALAAGVEATIGRFGAGEANGFISGPLTDTLGVRVAGQYGYGSPWQKSYTRDDELGRKNYLNGRILLNWAPTADLKIALNLNGWRDTSEPQTGQFVSLFPQLVAPGGGSAIDPRLANAPFSPSDPRASDWSPDYRPNANKRQYQASLRGDLNVSEDIVLTSITSYVNYRSRQEVDNDGTPIEQFQYRDVGTIKSFNQELRLAGGEGSGFRWVFGGNFESSKTHELQNALYKDSSVALLYGNFKGQNYTDQKFRNYAVFANGEYDLGSDLTFKAGARYTNTRVKGFTCTQDAGDGTVNGTILFFYSMLNPGAPLPNLAIGDCVTLDRNFQPGPFVLTQKEDNVAWRIGFDYKPSRDLLIYANVAKGYKGGSFPTYASLIYTSFLPVVQESLLDYEAGFKARLLDRKLSVNGAVFWYDYKNKQLLTKQPDLLSGLSQQIANIPKSRIRGAELEMSATPVEGLRLTGAMTYLDAKITEYVGTNAGGTQADFAGTKIPFTPKWQFLATADYDLPVTGPVRPFIGATFTKRSSTTSIVGSASGAIINPGFRTSVPIGEVYDIKGYGILDLRAGVAAEDESWRLMFWAKNVTNKYYWNNAITAFENVVRYAGQPATYGVTFGHKFGQ
jgi:outer membrane receptor protein involved in Fe transport